MPNVEVFYNTVKEYKNKESKKDLLWYDTKKHKMYSFNASKLDFKYKYDNELNEYRMLPDPIDEIEKYSVNVLDRKSIDKWFDSFLNYNNISSSIVSRGENSITFFVNSKELDDFVYSLERNNFRFLVEK